MDTRTLRRPFNVNEIIDEPTDLDELAGAVRPPLLIERGKTHGSFEDNAIISQSIKRMLRAAPGWEGLTDIEREAMDMIALKFSRILSGKSLSKEHWEDVVGYAKLIEERCI